MNAGKESAGSGPATAVLERARPAGGALSLACGCVSISCEGAAFEIRWCPQHQMMHGGVPPSKRAAVMTEKRAHVND